MENKTLHQAQELVCRNDTKGDGIFETTTCFVFYYLGLDDCCTFADGLQQDKYGYR